VPAVPHPDLSTVEGLARESLAKQRQALQEHLADPEAERADLAAAFGRMADLYQVYGLHDPADIAYGNARTLAPESFRWAYLHGLSQTTSGSPEEAAASFAEALELSPADVASRVRLAEAQLALGSPQVAEEVLLPILKGNEASEDPAARAAALYGLGRAAAVQGNYRKSVDLLEKALELAPQAGTLRYPLAQAYRKLGNREEAERQLAAGGRGSVSPPDPLSEELESLAAGAGALMAQGSEALVGGRLDEAEALYRQAVAAEPRSVEARRNLAVALIRGDQAQEAERVLEGALRLSPNEPLLLFDLANAQGARGETDAALQSFGRALTAAPTYEAALFNRANLLMQLQRWPEAEQDLRQLLDQSPNHAQARYLIAMAIFQQGFQEEGLVGLRQVLEEEPDLSAARLSLASILAQTGDHEGARRQYVEILQRDPSPQSKASAAVELGRLALRAKRPEEAEGFLQRALELDPEAQGARLGLADLLMANGQHGKAAELYRELVTLQPSLSEARFRLASALAASGNPKAALEELETALEAAPGNMVVVNALAHLLATAPDDEVRDGERALELANRAYIAQQSLDFAETLGMAMAEKGDFTEAAQWQEALLRQARSLRQPETVRRLEKNLELYKAKKAVRTAALPNPRG